MKANVQEIGDLYIADDGVMEAPESEPESATAQEPAPATAQESQPTTEKLTEKSVEYNQKIEAELSETDARFAEELFGGDKDIYISEVKKMLAMGELDDILIYISETYSWNPDNSVAEEFVGKFVKRFS